MNVFICCIAPILLAGLFLYGLFLWDFPWLGQQDEDINDKNLIFTQQPQLPNVLNRFWLIIVPAGLLFASSVFCLMWEYFTHRVMYWELFYLDSFLTIVITLLIVTSILIVNKWFGRQLGIKGDTYQTYVEHRGLLGMFFAVTGVIFWLAVLPFLLNDYQHIDQLEIEHKLYNLVYIESSEEHAHFILYQCGDQNIFCERIARSKLDYCRSFQSGYLNYDEATRELSAEIITCFEYTGFVYKIP